MRIEHIDIADYDSLSGSFRFPATELGLWAAPNDSGKSRLARAVIDLFYGSAIPGESRSGWIMGRLSLDDGRPFVIARDLAAGTLQITDSAGENATAQLLEAGESRPLGECLFGLSREQFAALSTVDHAGLLGTIGHPALRRLLIRGRGPDEAPGFPPGNGKHDADPPGLSREPDPDHDAARPRAASDPESTIVLSAAPRSIDDDLEIIRPADTTMPWSEEEGEEPAALASSPPLVGPRPDPLALDELDDPLDSESVRLGRLKGALDTQDGRLQERRESLARQSAVRDEKTAERDRLERLSGAEPGDVEKLAQLLDVMKRIHDKGVRLSHEEEEFREGLAGKGTDLRRLRHLDHIFQDLDAEQREFLDSYRQDETVLRGNLALVRSESRLDESRIESITRAREAASKTAFPPLAIAALGMFGSQAVRFLPAIRIPASAFLALGIVGAVAGAALLWRARRLGEADRQRATEELRRKSEQLGEFDAESERAHARLSTLALEKGSDSPESLLDSLDEWRNGEADLRDLERFERQSEEIEREMATLREKLGSFEMPGDGVSSDPASLDAAGLEALLQDYVRFFELHHEGEEAERIVSEIEEDLARLETERAEIEERIGSILAAAGIVSDGNLEQALVIHARGGDFGAADPFPVGEDPLAADGEAPAGEADTSWTSPVSVRMEAILRRFLPDVREVEVDAALRPSLRLDSREERIRWPELGRRLSGAALDQVCFALRLAVVECLAAAGERLPLILDDPLVRCDDTRYDQALDFLATDASTRNQVVLLTAHEVRSRWFLHQFPQLRSRIVGLTDPAPAGVASSPVVSSPGS